MTVTRAEAGQKLLNFLDRRLKATPSELHRWIRTGQVRLNGGRCKAFARVEEGDIVRVPPFAVPRRVAKESVPPAGTAADALPVVWENEDLLVLNKPAGLPTQGGTGHADSVADRLARLYAGADFVPAPVHRLDKDTSGLLLAGKTHAALRRLTDALAGRSGEAPRKEYLAWIRGMWPRESPRELRDMLIRTEGVRKMRTLSPPVATNGTPMSAKVPDAREALCLVRPLENRIIDGSSFTLLLLRLITGRTHQIRVQLASRGFPVAGDPRYGDGRGGLKLHAFRLTLPPADGENDLVITCPPPWDAPWNVAGPAEPSGKIPFAT